MQEKWLQWAIEIQAIAQAGLTYGRDAYDKERYARLREIAAEMVASQTELPVEKVRGLFCNETGYQTPKVDTRAAVFQKDRILLVQEANGTWSLPGGWCDVNRSVAENTVKETLEEAGLRVREERLIAVQDRNRHNPPPYPYGWSSSSCSARRSAGSLSRTSKRPGAPSSPEKRCPPPWPRKRSHGSRSCSASTRKTTQTGSRSLIRI